MSIDRRVTDRSPEACHRSGLKIGTKQVSDLNIKWTMEGYPNSPKPNAHPNSDQAKAREYVAHLVLG